MPYFQRKSYAEMLADAVKTPPGEIGVDAVPHADLMQRAAAILKEESTQLPKYPSTPSMPMPMPDSFAVPGRPPEGIVMLQPKAAVRSGQTGKLVISVTNDSGAATVCTVSATDLVSVSGGRISQGQLRISPSGASIAPDASADFDIAIDIPSGAAPGQYAGMLVVSGFETVQAVLTVSVIS